MADYGQETPPGASAMGARGAATRVMSPKARVKAKTTCLSTHSGNQSLNATEGMNGDVLTPIEEVSAKEHQPTQRCHISLTPGLDLINPTQVGNAGTDSESNNTWGITSHSQEVLTSRRSMLQDSSLSSEVSDSGLISTESSSLTHGCRMTDDHTPEIAYPHTGARQATLSEAQRKVLDLLICTQVDTLTTEVRELTRRHEGCQFTIERLADRTYELETDVRRMTPARSAAEDSTLRPYADKDQPHRVDSTQPLYQTISEDEGEYPHSQDGAQNSPDPWFFWLNTSEKSDYARDRSTVRNLMVLEEYRYGARISTQSITDSMVLAHQIHRS